MGYLSNDATLQRAWSTCSAVAALQRLRRRNHLQAADLLGGRGHQVPQRARLLHLHRARCRRLRSRRCVAQHPPESHVAEQRAAVDGRLLRVPPGDDPGGWRHVALYHANTNAIAAVVDIPDHIRRLQGAGNAWHCCGARRAPVDPHAGTGAEGQWTSEAAWGHPECERHHGEHGAEGVRVCVHWTQPGERAAEFDGGDNPAKVEYFKTTSMAV